MNWLAMCAAGDCDVASRAKKPSVSAIKSGTASSERLKLSATSEFQRWHLVSILVFPTADLQE